MAPGIHALDFIGVTDALLGITDPNVSHEDWRFRRFRMPAN